MGRLYDELTTLERLYPQKEEQTLPPLLVVTDVPDLALAYRELEKLARADGDLGAEYWSTVIKLLSWAEEAHRGLARDH